MADELDALLERVEDQGVREELRDHISRLRRKRQFGLVFESHLPERIRLPDHPIRRGSKVVRRDAPAKETPQQVVQVKGELAVLAADGDTESEEVSCDELVVVAQFGEPIYPGLRRLGSVDRGGDKPAHVVIKGENYHALEALRFSHAGKVDCIYIDPPYNTGARDWKYDNDYVDADDGYRHSKWLAFMERRLRLARDLLNPDDSVLIVTIDEKEVHRLGLLLEQTFADSRIQMISITINPKGTARSTEFSRVNEFAFVVIAGDRVIPSVREDAKPREIRWRYLRRTEASSARGSRPRQFYPIFVDRGTGRVVDVGDPMTDEVPRDSIKAPEGAAAVFPVNDEGVEMIWGLTPESFVKALDEGFVRVTPAHHNFQQFTISYLTEPNIRKVASGELEVTGTREDGSKIVVDPGGILSRPTTVWRSKSHDAGAHGTTLIKQFVPGRSFPFPKSLYAVEDVLRLFVRDQPAAVVLDFFAGSGTTAHAVARLNRQHGGSCQSISVTNNVVSAEEARDLRDKGLMPGDPEWEKLGIFEYITRPRITAAMTGETPDGEPVKADYKFTDESSMSKGFEENVEFLELKYLDIEDVELDLAFKSVAPLLWLRAGGAGPMIDRRCDDAGEPKSFDTADRYGVLFDPDDWRTFVERLPESVSTAFVVTDSPSVFASIAAELPTGIDVVRLYENYLTTFAINRGR